MERYERYKDSGIEWIGEIPEGWGVKKLKYGVTVNPPKKDVDKDSTELVVFLPMEKVGEDGKIDCSIMKPISDLYNGYPFFRKNDVIIAKITPCFENGKGAFLDKLATDYGFGSTEFHVLRAKENVNNLFLYYVTKSELFMKVGEAFMSGAAGQKRVPTDFISDFPLVSPHPDAQTTIANYLDRKTAEIDELIAQKERLIELYEEDKVAIINQAVTKGIDPDVRLKDSGVDWLGEIPGGWEVKRLKHLTQTISKGTTPSTIGKEVNIDGEIRFIKAENIYNNAVISEPENYIDNATNNLLERSQLEENDILFVIAGATIGKVAVLNKHFLPANTNQAVSFIRLSNKENVNFIWYWLQSGTINELLWLDAVQSAQPNLSMENLGNFVVPFPSSDDQTAVVHHIENETAHIDAKIAKTKGLSAWGRATLSSRHCRRNGLKTTLRRS